MPPYKNTQHSNEFALWMFVFVLSYTFVRSKSMYPGNLGQVSVLMKLDGIVRV